METRSTFCLALACFLSAFAAVLAFHPEDKLQPYLDNYAHASLQDILHLDFFTKRAVVGLVALCTLVWYLQYRHTGIYLLDFYCYKPPQSLKASNSFIIAKMREHQVYSEDNIVFQERVMEASGMGKACAVSKGVWAHQDGIKDVESKRNQKSYGDAMEESESIIFDVVGNLLAKSRIHPSEVDIVAVSCSCFAPTPSMAAMLVNRFKFKESVRTFNLSGMGCSSSVICVDMVQNLLKAMPNQLALVVNHENITNCYYMGQERSYLICNCLFRLGGAAALMTNRPKDRWAAKYDFVTSVRTHTGNDDDSFSCMGMKEDGDGILGVFLRRNVVAVAGRAMAKNIRSLGPLVLPYIEQMKYAVDNSYTPDFKTCFEHFLLHTGGRGVLDNLEKSLQLSAALMAPSRAALSRFGNTSAASTWYILSHIEHNGKMRKGDRVWQLGFGGGFKCNSAVWRARRCINQSHSCWMDD